MVKIDGDLAEIIGIHIGDGCISINKRYHEYYLGGDIKEEKEYHETWVKPLFDKKVMIPILKKSVQYKNYYSLGVYGFYIFDKKIVDFFQKFGLPIGTKINVSVPTQIIKSKTLTKRFLRGLFDTDGSLYFERNKSSLFNNQSRIKIGLVSKKLIKQIFIMLKRLGLHPRLKKPYKGKKDLNYVYSLLLYRKSDIKFFISFIGFHNSKHYTKWLVYNKIGYCPPYTTLIERKAILGE